MRPFTPERLPDLACPRCKGALEARDDLQEFHCAPCGRAYPIRQGIPVLLEGEARPLATP